MSIENSARLTIRVLPILAIPVLASSHLVKTVLAAPAIPRLAWPYASSTLMARTLLSSPAVPRLAIPYHAMPGPASPATPIHDGQRRSDGGDY